MYTMNASYVCVYVLWGFASEVECVEGDEDALARRREKRVQTLPAVVAGVHQLWGVECTVARAAAAHESAVALCNTNIKKLAIYTFFVTECIPQLMPH